MKKIKFMDCSFRDGFQSCLGARVKTEDFLPALDAAVKAGINHIEIGGGARFQALYFYCQEDAFEMMDKWRATVGPDVNLQTLSRGVNVVGLSSQSSDIIDLHAKLFKKHGITTIRNFDALNDVRNLDVSGRAIAKHGLKHQVTVTLMGLAPNLTEAYAHTPKFYIDRLNEILQSGIPFDSVAFKDASGTSTPATVFETVKQAREILDANYGKGAKEIQFHTHDTAGMAVACNMAAIEAEIDSMSVSDFTETTEKTEYVKFTIKDHGEFVVRLRKDIAPITVDNFQKLVSEKFYDGLTFHRIMKGFMIQGGDPQGNGTGGSGTTIRGEFAQNGVRNDLSHIAGVISMARLSYPMDSATSQFFVCNADASRSLDGGYAGFGYVVAGLETVMMVSDVEVTYSSSGEMSKPVEKVVMEKVCFVTKN